MQGSLGEKIGEGAFADVHAWAPGRVVKLFKPGVPMVLGWHEAHMAHAAFVAGAPTAQLFGTIFLDGRLAMVLERLDGPTLLQLTRSGSISRAKAGAVLAGVFHAVHKVTPPRGVQRLRDSMASALKMTSEAIPQHIATGILTLLERLPPGDQLCHGDLHPDNIIMTAKGPRLIDWLGAVRAPAALDIAITHFQLSEIAPLHADIPERPREVAAAMQAEYARLAGLSPASLTEEMTLYAPIARARALFGPALHQHREMLIERIEAALR